MEQFLKLLHFFYDWLQIGKKGAIIKPYLQIYTLSI